MSLWTEEKKGGGGGSWKEAKKAEGGAERSRRVQRGADYCTRLLQQGEAVANLLVPARLWTAEGLRGELDNCTLGQLSQDWWDEAVEGGADGWGWGPVKKRGDVT